MHTLGKAVRELLTAIFDPDIPFLLYALLAGILSSISFGIVGTIVVTKRISYIAGAISHCVLGGIGVGMYLQQQMELSFVGPMIGAFISAIMAAITIGLVSIYFKEREDTVIGALWSLGMAIGLIFISKTSGYLDPMSYLFGNILLVTKQNLLAILLLDIIVIAVFFLFFEKFIAICFDEEFVRIKGIKTGRYNILFLCLIALTIVTLVNIVGIVLVIALLTLPAAIANQFSKKLFTIMIFAATLCAIFNILGIAISYVQDLPSGPVIIIVSSLVYFSSLIFKKLKPI